MQERKRKIEILAPAGSRESMAAAIGAGADAVYIGGSQFGARAYANNLDTDAMLAAIDYVHLRGKKLYLTVNTLLKQEEIGEPLYRYLKPYYEQGLDAVIVQDAGVMEFISREFPGLPIHASTQMSLTMAEGAMNFRGLNVVRLVNARELSLSEIARVRKDTNLEIESFVHGALCYCYSGQCLMSSLIGGRSGNRGRCAQPCRMEYIRKDMGQEQGQQLDENRKKVMGRELYRDEKRNMGRELYRDEKRDMERGLYRDGKQERYLLSPKDICTLDMVPQLIEAGIDSFKIEGRMKRYEYSAGVTQAYRTEVDRYFELGAERYKAYHREHPEVLREEVTRLQDLYNRGGFTKGYYQTHNGQEMMSMERPNHSGVFVGKVTAVRKNCAMLTVQEKLHPQDILEIRMQDGGVYEFTLKNGCEPQQELAANFTPGLPVQKGDKVFRTKNNELLQKISKECYEKDSEIPVTGCLTAIPDRPATFSVFMAGEERSIATGQGSSITADLGNDIATSQGSSITADQGNDIATSQGSSITVEGDLVQRAQKQPMSDEKIKSQLGKTGDTPFRFTELEIQTEGNIFLPVSKLNELRRNALEELEKEIVRKYRRSSLEGRYAKNQPCIEPEKIERSNLEENRRKEVSASVMSKEQLEAVLESRVVTRIYYDIAALPLEEVSFYAERARQEGKKFLLRLPQICRADTYDWLVSAKETLVSEWIDGYLIRNYEELYLITALWEKETAGKERVADAMLYVMNQEAKRFFYRMGLTGFTAPYEENQRELGELGLEDMELTVYGRLPLMTSAQCIRKNTTGCIKWEAEKQNSDQDSSQARPLILIDRKKKELPVWNFCRFCYNTIYNPECLSLIDAMEKNPIEELSAKGTSMERAGRWLPRAYRFDFTFESGQETSAILDQGKLDGESYTRGHFKRGVE